MDEQRLVEIAERASKASDGLKLTRIDHADDEVIITNATGQKAITVCTWMAKGFLDAEFIVHAKADVLALREALRSLREERDGWHQSYHKEANLRMEADAELQRLREGMEPFRHFVERERALRDAKGKGGQSVGDSPSISPSVLKELERMLELLASPVEGSKP